MIILKMGKIIMKVGKLRYLLLNIGMGGANALANIVAISVMGILGGSPEWNATEEQLASLAHLDDFFIVTAFVMATVATMIYELPISRALKTMRLGGDLRPELMDKARRRIVNEPYFAGFIDLIIWFAAAVVSATVGRASLTGGQVAWLVTLDSILIGIIAVTAAFFMVELVVQKWLAPVFFPEGKLWAAPGALRVLIGARLSALALAISLVPLVFIILTVWKVKATGGGDPSASMDGLARLMANQVVVFIAVAVSLTWMLAGNLAHRLREMVEVIGEVRNGVFNRKVRVTTNDEIGYTGDAINEMTEGLKERDMIKDTFGKYVAPEVRDEVLSGRIALDGETKEVTVLFADLRGFTAMTETHDPKLMVNILNAYFKEMAQAIREQEGSILQFLGDEIYAVFGAPISRPDHPVRAFHAGLEMNRRLVELNQDLERQSYPKLSHGIGIHTGTALAATLGSPDRLSYLLVGDTVNLASRLQTLTREMGTSMIISSSTHDLLPDTSRAGVSMTWLGTKEVRGKRRVVGIYGVNDDLTPGS